MLSNMERAANEIKQSLAVTFEIGTLVEQFIDYGYNISQFSKDTMKTRSTHLRQFVRFCKLADLNDVRKLTIAHIDTYYKYYGKAHKKSTCNTGKRIIKVFMRWLLDYKEICAFVRPDAIKSVKVADNTPQAIDAEIIKDVIQKADRQDSLLIATGYEAGLRIKELSNIRMSDIQGDSMHIIGKGGIERTAHITPELAGAIQSFAQKEGRLEHGYLFQRCKRLGCGKMTTGTARLHIQKCFHEIAGVKMHPHQLRHSFAINLLNNGCDIVTIQKLLGHSDITTTMVYLRIADPQIRRNYDAYIGESFISSKSGIDNN